MTWRIIALSCMLQVLHKWWKIWKTFATFPNFNTHIPYTYMLFNSSFAYWSIFRVDNYFLFSSFHALGSSFDSPSLELFNIVHSSMYHMQQQMQYAPLHPEMNDIPNNICKSYSMGKYQKNVNYQMQSSRSVQLRVLISQISIFHLFCHWTCTLFQFKSMLDVNAIDTLFLTRIFGSSRHWKSLWGWLGVKPLRKVEQPRCLHHYSNNKMATFERKQ
jgi:hypothetical protein